MSLDNETVERLLQDLEARLRGQGAWAGLPVFYEVLSRDLAPLIETAPDVVYVLERVCDMLERLGYVPLFPPLPPLRIPHLSQLASGEDGHG